MRDPEFNPSMEEYAPPGGSPLPEEIAPPASEETPAEHPELPSEFAAPGLGGVEQEKNQKKSFHLSALMTASVAVALTASITSLFFGSPIVRGTLKSPPSAYTVPAAPSGKTSPSGTTAPGETTPGEEPTTFEGPVDPYAVTAFPSLPNQDPDFAGNYAWAGTGTEQSEEYLILNDGSQTTFLVAGGYYRNAGFIEEDLSGCVYDRDNNVLTLSNFNRPGAQLNANLMGNGFKICLVGENHLGQIELWGAMYGGSVTFTGTGSLILNENQNFPVGLLLQGENSPSCIMADSGVTLESYGSQAAFAVLQSTLEQALYYLAPQWLHGGAPAYGTLDENGVFSADTEEPYLFTVIDGEGQMATHITISNEPVEQAAE